MLTDIKQNELDLAEEKFFTNIFGGTTLDAKTQWLLNFLDIDINTQIQNFENFVKPLIEKGGCAGALVAFFTKDEPDKWRLSFIRMDYEFSMGKVKEKLTPAKRYSYLVGKGEPCHTAKQRLYPIFMDDNTNPGIDELEEAFSVEKVTNEFFNLYKEKYIQLKEYLESNEEFMNEAAYRNFTSEQFAKKLMGQIVFLYFIQKKGWLGVEAIPVTMTDGTLVNICVPAYTWKIILCLPEGENDLSRINAETSVMAVFVPNIQGCQYGGSWEQYKTSVNEIEKLTGFDFFELIDDKIEEVLEESIYD